MSTVKWILIKEKYMADVTSDGKTWSIYSEEGNLIGTAFNLSDAVSLYKMVSNSESMKEKK
jgi:hypothetical protein